MVASNTRDLTVITPVSTPYGLIRFYDKTHPLDKHLNSKTMQLRFYVVIAKEDGGLTLPDGETYYTSPMNAIVWDVYKGVPLSKQAGTTFPVRRKVEGKKLSPFETPQSEVAQVIGDAILDLYLSGSLNSEIFDTDLVITSQDLRRKHFAGIRQLEILERELNEQNSAVGKKLFEDYKERYPSYGVHASPFPKIKVTWN